MTDEPELVYRMTSMEWLAHPDNCPDPECNSNRDMMYLEYGEYDGHCDARCALCGAEIVFTD